MSRAAEGFDLRWKNMVDAGAPIDAAHYQVLDAAGRVAVPTQHLGGANIEAVERIETAKGSDPHSLRLWLTDAEGNVGAPVSAPLTYECISAKSPTGAQQLGVAVNGHAEQTVQQGQGATLSGTLRSAGGPVATTPICVFSRVETDLGKEFIGMALTSPSGEYRFPISAGPSREVIVVHRDGHRQLRAGAQLRTVVRPTLRARNTVVRNGESAYFEGEIPGPHNDT